MGIFLLYSILMESRNKKLIIGIAIFIIIAGLSGWFIYRDYVEHSVFNNNNNQSGQTDSLENLIKSGKVKVETEPVSSEMSAEEIKKQMPDLDREIIITTNLSEEDKKRATTEIKMLSAELKADFDKLEDWLTLGIWKKMIGDYEGAGEAWQFATLIRPNDPVAFHNLGDLYSQYLPDFPKAEKYYKLAIEKDKSHQPFFYVKLFEFYRYYSKKPDLAENTLLQALKVNPNDVYLTNLLADFRKEK